MPDTTVNALHTTIDAVMMLTRLRVSARRAMGMPSVE